MCLYVIIMSIYVKGGCDAITKVVNYVDILFYGLSSSKLSRRNDI